MNKEILKAAFREAKKAARLDFAVTNPDGLGDCNSCVWAAIVDKYGESSRGIWAKAWRHGMNGGRDIAYLDRVYISHDLTEEQAAAVLAVFAKYYTIESGAYSPDKCIIISEKE
jgi:hypothetical protein